MNIKESKGRKYNVRKFERYLSPEERKNPYEHNNKFGGQKHHSRPQHKQIIGPKREQYNKGLKSKLFKQNKINEINKHIKQNESSD